MIKTLLEFLGIFFVLFIITFLLLRVDTVKKESVTSTCHPPEKGYELRSHIANFKEACVYYPIPEYGSVKPQPQTYKDIM